MGNIFKVFLVTIFSDSHPKGRITLAANERDVRETMVIQRLLDRD